MIHLLQLSDTHFAAGGEVVNGRNPAARLAEVLEAVRLGGSPIDALVVTGDLTDDGSRAACADLAAALAPLGVPILAVPGNHDDPRVVRDLFRPDALEIGRWRLIGLDTSRPGQIHGTVDVAAEMSRLDGYDRSFILLAMHHPPWSPSDHPWFQLEGAAELATAVARRPHVRAFLTGHLHRSFSGAAAGTQVLGCPSVLVEIQVADGEVMIGGVDTGARICVLHDDGEITSRVVRA